MNTRYKATGTPAQRRKRAYDDLQQFAHSGSNLEAFAFGYLESCIRSESLRYSIAQLRAIAEGLRRAIDERNV